MVLLEDEMRKFLFIFVLFFITCLVFSQTNSPAYGQIEVKLLPDSYSVNGIYVKRSGETDWGVNYNQNTLNSRANSTSITFVAGLYDIKITSPSIKAAIVFNVLIRENYVTVLNYYDGGIQVMPHKKMEGY
jgi:hypothetical protein